MTPELKAYIEAGYGTLPDLIAIHARQTPDRLALIDDTRSLTYAALFDEMNRFAVALQNRGMTQGDSVSVCARNSTNYGVVFLGTLMAGMTVAPLAPSSTPDDLVGMIRDSGAKLFFTDEESYLALETRLPDLNVKTFRLDRTGENSFDAFLAAPGTKAAPVDIPPDQPFNIIYSSGTTGTPKGIVQSHGMRWAHCRPVDPVGFGPEAISLLSTPLYSNTTLVAFIPTLAGGGTVILMSKFNTERYLQLAEDWKVTHTMLVPVQYQRLMDFPEFDSYDLSSFREKLCTSAPFNAALKREVLDRWPGGLTEYYGMTEGGGSCVLECHTYPDKLHTVGHPVPGHDIRIIDEQGNELPPGQTGELIGASGVTMNGYHNKPDKTKETEWYSPEGVRFIRTGDVGQFDEDGFLTLMDRKKDMIISGGFNIYPSDIEHLLRKYPDVKDVAVVGVASREWGETPVAFVVLKTGSITSADALKSWANDQLGKTQRVSDLILRDDLPRSAIGKILKRELRDLYSPA